MTNTNSDQKEIKPAQHFPAPGGCIPGHAGNCDHPIYMSEEGWNQLNGISLPKKQPIER